MGNESALLSPGQISAAAPPPPSSTDPATGRAPIKPGQSIGSEIKVLEVLGEGGFGIVYLASSSRVGFCAVKTLRDELVSDERVVELFQKEARIWIELGRHPYLVRAFYVEEVHGRLYVAMEYVPPNARGINGLETYLRRQLPELGQALWWAIEFCHGMEYAYSKGIRCHRDIKPANILIGPDNRIRITDFGIAGVIVAKAGGEGAATGVAGEGATQAGSVFGTPTHMPPEQFVAAASCDARSDIYSFGVVLFEMTSGKLPFYPPPIAPGPDRSRRIWTALARLHTEEPVSKIDSPLFPIIAKCMEKDPAKRYQTFPELRADLEALLKQKTGEVVAVPSERALEAIDLSNKSMSLAALGQPAEALRCYDEALAIQPSSAVILNNKGNTLNQLRRREEAVACFDEAIAADPNYAAPHLNKAISFVWLNQYDEALKCLDRACTLDPRLVDAWTTKGVIFDRVGQEDKATECYERALAIEPGDPIAWFNKAGRLHRKGQREEALECVERALQSDPRYVIAWVTKGVLLGDTGRHQEALQALDRALVLDPHSGKSWYNKGNVFTSLERFGEALNCFQRAASLDPGFPLIWFNKALSELKLERFDEATGSLRQFLNLAPPHDEYRANAMGMLERLEKGERIVLGRLNKGATVLSQDADSDEVVKVPVSSESPVSPNTKDQELTALKAKLAAPEKLSPGELFEIAERVMELTPGADRALKAVAGNADVDPNLGPEECLRRAHVTHRQGQFEKALGWYERVLAANPENSAAMAGKAESLRRLNRFEAALEAFDLALKHNPKDASAWVGRGQCLDRLGQFEDAAGSAEKAIQLDPENPAYWNNRGRSLYAIGDFEQALQCYDHALDKDSRFAFARFNKAVVEQKLGRNLEAARSFQQFLAIAPPHLASQIENARERLAELRTA